jgi:hypothetical protein
MSDFFEPTDDPSIKRLLEKARAVNAERDVIDRANGDAAPIDCPPDVFLRTVITALVTGLEGRRKDNIAEGIAMLQEMDRRLRDA